MRENTFILWASLIAVLVIVLNLPVPVTRQAKAALREGMAPLQGALTGFGRQAREAVASVRGIGGLVSENQKMAAELVRLRNEVREARVLEGENRELRDQLQFLRRAPRKLVASEVIARDISDWWQTIRIGRGSRDGVARNMAVMTSDGVVGHTIEVSPHTSDVLLLSDPTCKVAAQLPRTGVYGIVRGRGPALGGQVLCRLEFINKDASVKPGDEVATSGLGGVFPRGLLIGQIESVGTDKSGLYQYADVIPQADLARLSYVFVITEEEDAVEELLQKKKPGGGEGT